MHFDRFSDVSKLIYLGFSKDPACCQDLEGGSQSPDERLQTEEQLRREHESGPLNYNEVTVHRKPLEELCPQGANPISDRVENNREVGKSEPGSNKGCAGDSNNKSIDELISAVSAEYDRQEEEMKELDRLVQDLLLEASQIPDIPYHAREDGLPFRYCTQDDIVKHRNKLGGGYHQSQNDNNVSVPPASCSSEANNNIDVNPYKPSVDYLPRNWNSTKSVQKPHGGATADGIALNGEIEYLHQQPNRSSKDVRANTSASSGYEDYLPRNWMRETKPVTIEQDRSHIKWSAVPIIENRVDTGEEYRVPILNQTKRQDEWNMVGTPIAIEREDSTLQQRDVFQDMKRQQQQIESDFKKLDASSKDGPRKPVRYSRSFSADNFGERESEDWLEKQKAKLELKRSGSIRQQNPMMGRGDGSTPAWLQELKQRNMVRHGVSHGANPTQAVERPIEVQIQHEHQQSLRTNSVSPRIVMQEQEQRMQPQMQSEKTELMQQKSFSEASSSGAGSDSFDSSTPRFPACPPTPYMNRSAAKRLESFSRRAPSGGQRIARFKKPNGMVSTDDESEVEDEIAKIMLDRRQEEEMQFTVDSTSNWYKPSATREETISALLNREKGTFLIRNSNSFPGAFGLAIKVDDHNVRHFLIEPTRAGVRLRGSEVEPVFGSLSALVYAHTMEPLALPCKLKLPSEDNLIPTSWSQSTTSSLLKQGAACQLLFFGENNMEMLTGAEAIQRSVGTLYMAKPTRINLRLSTGGLVLTDIARERFFRLHFPLSSIIHAGVDPASRTITVGSQLRKFFGIVVSKGTHNSVLVLSEFEEGQPAVAIVSFIMRVIQWRSL